MIFLQLYYLLLPHNVLEEIEDDDNDDCSDEEDEEYFIRYYEIDSIMYKRHIKEINGHKVPVSIQLLGYQNK